jgi:hypothetical protein
MASVSHSESELPSHEMSSLARMSYGEVELKTKLTGRCACTARQVTPSHSGVRILYGVFRLKRLEEHQTTLYVLVWTYGEEFLDQLAQLTTNSSCSISNVSLLDGIRDLDPLQHRLDSSQLGARRREHETSSRL